MDPDSPEFEMTLEWDEHWALSRATLAAMSAGCQKSQRGVIVWHRTHKDLGYALGQNQPPFPFDCDGSDACRAACNKVAVHAEQVALLEWLGRSKVDRMALRNGCEMLHVKVVDGKPVPSGPPSCWQCSRLILETGMFKAMWLLHEDGLRAYTPEEFHRLTLENCNLPVLLG